MQDLESAVMEWGQQGFCCSQIMLLAGLAFTEKEDSDMIAAMNGLCRGGFSRRCTCGALTGALCLMGFYAGKGSHAEERDPRLEVMTTELQDWFAKKWGADGQLVGCGDILGYVVEPEPGRCYPMVLETLVKTLQLLEEHDFDVRKGRSS